MTTRRSTRPITRRTLVTLGLPTASLALLAACGQAYARSAPPAGPTVAITPATSPPPTLEPAPPTPTVAATSIPAAPSPAPATASPTIAAATAPTPAVPSFDAERAMRDLIRQCDFGPRNPGSAGYAACLDFLRQELATTTGALELQEFTTAPEGETLNLTNLIARYPGTAGEPDAGDLVLCAHWDTRPFADHDPDPANQTTPIVGANDGASGVAVLLELARLFENHQPPRSVAIVLFDGEDYGHTGKTMFLGSRYYAEHLPTPRPAEAILLDMIGDADLRIPRDPASQAGAPDLVNRVWSRAAELGHNDIFVDELGPSITDDHISLLNVGVPAIDLIDFAYPYWHTLADTPDKCSAASLGVVGEVVAAFVYQSPTTLALPLARSHSA